MPRKTIYFILLIIILGFLVNFVFENGGLIDQYQTKKENRYLELKIDSLQTVLAQKNQYIKRLSTDSLLIEKEIRTKFGYTRKGENLYIILRNQDSARKESTQPPNSPE